MANSLTLTSLTENIFRAKDRVARELVGFIPSVLINSGSEGVSINGTVNSFVTAAPTLNTSYTPAMTIPSADDQTVSAQTMTIGQVANVRIPLRGEDLRQLDNTAGGQRVIDDMIAQAMRKVVNTIESYVGTIVYKGASRAVGTAGTTPFASNHNTVNSIRQILVDNGAPLDDVSLVINSLAGTNLRNLSYLYKVNEAGTSELARQGVLLDISGIKIRESAGVASHTAGAGTGALINGAEAVGQTSLTFDTLTVNTTGIKAGDIITTAADTTNKYVVKTGTTSTSGDIVIGAPGLLVAAPDNNAITVGSSYTANVAFHRNAVELVVRPPAMPYGGDSAVDRMTVVDDYSGLVFDIALYKGYGMNMLDITTFYDAKVWKTEFVATLLG
jgi:hypothetical protein